MRRQLLVVLLLPLLAAAIAVAALVHTHSLVLRSARGVAPRTAPERARMLEGGRCVVARRGGDLIGKLAVGRGGAPRVEGGRYVVERLDVRATAAVDTAQVRVMACGAAGG
jgi:hypothetical protein